MLVNARPLQVRRQQGEVILMQWCTPPALPAQLRHHHVSAAAASATPQRSPTADGGQNDASEHLPVIHAQHACGSASPCMGGETSLLSDTMHDARVSCALLAKQAAAKVQAHLQDARQHRRTSSQFLRHPSSVMLMGLSDRSRTTAAWPPN